MGIGNGSRHLEGSLMVGVRETQVSESNMRPLQGV